MMKNGIFEAKTLLTSLLEKIKGGEKEFLTRHGRPVARLVSNEQAPGAKIENAIQELRNLRSGLKLNGLSWKDLRDAGRR